MNSGTCAAHEFIGKSLEDISQDIRGLRQDMAQLNTLIADMRVSQEDRRNLHKSVDNAWAEIRELKGMTQKVLVALETITIMKDEVHELKTRVTKIEELVASLKGGAAALRWIWGVILAILGMLIWIVEKIIALGAR